MNIDQVVAQYSEQRPMYDRFTRKLKDLLEELLDSLQIDEYGIDGRTKKVDRFRLKIDGGSYTDPLREITDLSGLRIILHRLSDIPKVTKIIRSTFAVDPKNSKDKIEDLKVSQFGYRSDHLIVSMRKNRTELPEWQPFRKIKAEIQVRTDLQDVWAVFSRSLDYKQDADIPMKLRRRLFRISALFELADEELNNLDYSFKAQIKIYKEMLKRGELGMDLNIDSLRLFIENTKEGKYWIRRARKITGRPIDDWGDLSRAIRVAQFCKLKTIGDVQRVVRDAHGWGEKFISDYFARLAKAFGSKISSTDPKKDSIITGLIIGSHPKKFDDEILEGDFGFPHTDIIVTAYRAQS